MIIVEGPDGSGKTTLVERLLSNPDLKLVKGDRACTSDNGAIEDLAQWVDDQLDHESKHKVLYDRFPLFSDFAYGPLIRGSVSEKFEDFMWVHSRMNHLMNRHRPFMIFCLPPKQIVEENVRSNHEGKTEHLRGVLRSSKAIYDLYVYQAAMSPFTAQTWVWDYRDGDYSSLCQAIRSHLGH